MLILLYILIAWVLPPASLVIFYTLRYGPLCPCITTWWLGSGSPIGVEIQAGHFYWCPLGFIGLEIEMLP